MAQQIELSEHAERAIADAAALCGVTPQEYIGRFIEAWATYLSVEGLDPDQAWFWTPEWQVGECAAEADLASGRSTRYESDEAFIRALEARLEDATQTDGRDRD